MKQQERSMAISGGAFCFQELSCTFTGASCFFKHFAHLLHTKHAFCKMRAKQETAYKFKLLLCFLKKSSLYFQRNVSKNYSHRGRMSLENSQRTISKRLRKHFFLWKYSLQVTFLKQFNMLSSEFWHLWVELVGGSYFSIVRERRRKAGVENR